MRRGANYIPKWPFVMNRQSPQAKGLAAWWPFIPSGKGIPDFSGNGNDGTVTGVAAYTPTPLIDTFNWDGSTQIACGTGLAVSALSVSFWLLQTGTPPTSTYGQIIAKAGGGTRRFTVQSFSNQQRFSLTWSDGGIAEFNCDTEWTQNLLQFWCVTFDGGASNPQWYLNGIAQTGTYVAGSLRSITAGATDPVNLGRYDSDIYYWSNGQFGDLRVYDYALSASEVRALYDPATRYELYQRPRRVFGKASVGDTARPRYGDHHHVLAM